MTPTEALRKWLRTRVKPLPLDPDRMPGGEEVGWVQFDAPGSMTTDMWQALLHVIGGSNYVIRWYQGIGVYATGRLDISADGIQRLNKFMADA